ncbi:PEP-CTERM sorting domain-containing protein [Rheinheimera sp.]|uniref:PEP-CTERM sorting domain-containing protein n=1 Tax=Rheinheimera sp. TaxID=1869214 RepID=UPI002733C34E|nr:PEP-CTERM sorting domain-containing protein [Rheinheimera sp.]MDP2715475.1 PEP-CTERM sorting domain-containing protein [Rheinheimera sp.]
MNTSKWKLTAVVLALACTPVSVLASTIYYTDWGSPGTLDFSALPPPPPDQVIPGSSASYMWYCDQETPGPSCDGSNNARDPDTNIQYVPNMAQFRYNFYLPGIADTGYPVYLNDAYLYVAADDYFALYVNGNLLTPNGVWLDDTGPDYLATLFDLTSWLVTGENNEIFIFACDGYAPNPRVQPGATPAGGWNGCTTPTDRLNNWLLTDGLINLVYNTPGGDTIFSADLASGNATDSPTVWQARGVLMVPEPGTISLSLLGAMGLMLMRVKRKGQR